MNPHQISVIARTQKTETLLPFSQLVDLTMAVELLAKVVKKNWLLYYQSSFLDRLKK